MGWPTLGLLHRCVTADGYAVQGVDMGSCPGLECVYEVGGGGGSFHSAWRWKRSSAMAPRGPNQVPALRGRGGGGGDRVGVALPVCSTSVNQLWRRRAVPPFVLLPPRCLSRLAFQNTERACILSPFVACPSPSAWMSNRPTCFLSDSSSGPAACPVVSTSSVHDWLVGRWCAPSLYAPERSQFRLLP